MLLTVFSVADVLHNSVLSLEEAELTVDQRFISLVLGLPYTGFMTQEVYYRGLMEYVIEYECTVCSYI